MTDEERKAKAAVYDKAYRVAHRKEYNRANRKYYTNHREKELERKAIYRRANAEKYRKSSAIYMKTHHEEVLEHQARYRKTHQEKLAERYATYYKTHHEEVLERQARYCKTHPEKVAESQATYHRTHLEARRAIAEKRRAKYSNTPIDELLTSAEWLAILAQADGHCAYCDKEAKLTLDHVIPLSKGGTHSKDNVVPACLHCNSSKGNRTLEEWNAKRLIQAKK